MRSSLPLNNLLASQTIEGENIFWRPYPKVRQEVRKHLPLGGDRWQ